MLGHARRFVVTVAMATAAFALSPAALAQNNGTCSQCGVVAPAEDGPAPVPLGWTLERDGQGRITAVCPACTRLHARAIECKLDASWW